MMGGLRDLVRGDIFLEGEAFRELVLEFFGDNIGLVINLFVGRRRKNGLSEVIKIVWL